MVVSDLVDKLGLSICAGAGGLTRGVGGCYICDLLSLAMSGIEEGNVWITVQTNINTVAVAALTEAACIILPQGLKPDANTAERANSEDICILSFPGTAYEGACILKDLGI